MVLPQCSPAVWRTCRSPASPSTPACTGPRPVTSNEAALQARPGTGRVAGSRGRPFRAGRCRAFVGCRRPADGRGRGDCSRRAPRPASGAHVRGRRRAVAPATIRSGRAPHAPSRTGFAPSRRGTVRGERRRRRSPSETLLRKRRPFTSATSIRRSTPSTNASSDPTRSCGSTPRPFREVVACSGRNADERESVCPGSGRDDRQRSVSAGCAQQIGPARHGFGDERGQALTRVQDASVDSPVARSLGQGGACRLPAARFVVHEQHRPSRTAPAVAADPPVASRSASAGSPGSHPGGLRGGDVRREHDLTMFAAGVAADPRHVAVGVHHALLPS